MKTLVNLTLTALIVGTMIPTTQAEDNKKYYEVTEDGHFRYIYRQADVSTKSGIKPVTDRTFYQETIRQGLLPDDLSYRKYRELTPVEIKALLNQAPIGNFSEEDQNIAVEKEDIKSIATARDNALNFDVKDKVSENQLIQTQEDVFTDNLPWIVKVSVDPTDGYILPGEFAPIEACMECEPLNVPQIVNDILDHGRKENAISSTLAWES